VSKKFSKIVLINSGKKIFGNGILGFLLRTFFLVFMFTALAFVGVGIYFLKEKPELPKAILVKIESIEKQNRHLVSTIEKLRPNMTAIDTSYKEHRKLLYIPKRAARNEKRNLTAIDSLSIRGLVGYSNTLLEFFGDIAKNASTPQGKWQRLPLVFPLADNTKYVIKRPFAESLPDPFTGTMKAHLGIDLAAENGTPVLAPADGEVVFVSERDVFWGRTIKIAHADGYETLYAHLGTILVRHGQRVRRGTIIGTVGESGWATGPHLHYELIKNGVHLDPQIYNFASLHN